MPNRESAVGKKGFNTAALVLALAAIGGCASSQAAPQPAPATSGSRAEGAGHEHGHQAGMMEMCPMRVPGTTVSVSDTDGGVAVVFKTTGDVNELRHRVRHMAEMHDHHHAEGMASGEGMMGGGRDAGTTQGGPGMMMGMSHEGMVPATAAVDDVEGGARIALTPKDPSQLGSLRTHVRDHAERMSRGECPMMKGGPSHASEHQHEK